MTAFYLYLFMLCLLLGKLSQSDDLSQTRKSHYPAFPNPHSACSVPSLTSSQANFSLTAFWINLDSSVERRRYMEGLLSKMNLPHVRVPAVQASSSEYKQKLISLKKPCNRNTDTDIAVIMSHLQAIHTAVYKDPNPSAPCALILEDDVRFLFSLDIAKLILSAPHDFGILQLTTSNTEALQQLSSRYHAQGELWRPTHWQDTTKNKKTFLYWSAQAYLIQKAVVKTFIDDVIVNTMQGDVGGFKIINSFFPHECTRTRNNPCVLSNCLFSDSYIYAGGGPHYVSTLPLVSGARVGGNSTIHPLEVHAHRQGFQKIRQIALQMKKDMKEGRKHEFIIYKNNTGEC